jgi:hypothetical protein
MAGPRHTHNEHQIVRLFASVLAALLASVALAACGGSTTTTVTEANSAAQASTGSGTITAALPASSTSTAATGTPACTAGLLALSYLGGQGATGHGLLGFSLRNTGRASCHTFGYPGVLFLDKAGHALPTKSTRTTHDFFGDTPEVAITLAPGQTASFRLGVTHGIASTAGCTTAYGLQAIPPDDTRTLRTTIPAGAYECGAATVSPLEPGRSAYP